MIPIDADQINVIGDCRGPKIDKTRKSKESTEFQKFVIENKFLHSPWIWIRKISLNPIGNPFTQPMVSLLEP